MTERGPRLGVGRRAEVFAREGQAVKLYAMGTPKVEAFREAAILAMVEAQGLPAPAVHGVCAIDGRWGVVMDRAPAPTLAEAMLAAPEQAAGGLLRMAALHRRIHAVETHTLTFLPPFTARLARDIGAAPLPDPARRAALLDRLGAMPAGDRLCHGDFHPHNIMGSPGGDVVVDWVDACRGDPLADVCRSYVLMAPHAPALAPMYIDAYAAYAGIDRADILRWLPFVAAARLAEASPAEFAATLDLATTGFRDPG